jgi:hypothetical protein
VTLEASKDQTHWKTLDTAHASLRDPDSGGAGYAGVSADCLHGTWWYRGYFVTDDGSFKGGSDATNPRSFTC